MELNEFVDQVTKLIPNDPDNEESQKKEDETAANLFSGSVDNLRTFPVRVFVRVMNAEQLIPCDRNGLSDPYCVLKSGEVEILRTRVEYRTLFPRWFEEFDVMITQNTTLHVK
jgi:hypothetical protein